MNTPDDAMLQKACEVFKRVFRTENFSTETIEDEYEERHHYIIAEGMRFLCIPFFASCSFMLVQTCPVCGDDFLQKANKPEYLGRALEHTLCKQCERQQ